MTLDNPAGSQNIDRVIQPPAAVASVIFISGFNAQGAVREYANHLVRNRPELHGKIRIFSHRDRFHAIAECATSLDGPVTLVGNSLGGWTAARTALACGCIDTLVTLAPVGPLRADYRRIADCVRLWIDLRAPLGLADAIMLSLSLGKTGPWGYAPRPHATKFIDSPLGHARFWDQMDAACGYLMRDLACGGDTSGYSMPGSSQA